MPNLKELLNEYRAQVTNLEFSNIKGSVTRNPEFAAYQEARHKAFKAWQDFRRDDFEQYGLDISELFDQVWDELDHLFNPRPEQREVLTKWHTENSDRLIEKGIMSYEVVFYAIDELTEAYTFGGSLELSQTLQKIASIPLMTTEVLQEIIYESCRQLDPSVITGLDKVKIPVIG